MNPLLRTDGLPKFEEIKIKHIDDAMEEIITSTKKKVEKLFDSKSNDFDDFYLPVSDVLEEFSKVWGVISHLNSVKNTPEFREKYVSWVPKVTKLIDSISQDPRYFDKIEKLLNSQEYKKLDSEVRYMIKQAYESLVRQGAKLKGKSRERYKEINEKLSDLSLKFSNNILDSTQEYELFIKSKSDLIGLPDEVLKLLHNQAIEDKKDNEGKDIWKITLDAPSFFPVLKYADNRDLREKLYRAYVQRASSGNKDNLPVIYEILKLREEKAKILGYKNYGEYSVASKMARSSEEVIDFLEDLYYKGFDKASLEYKELKKIALEMSGIKKLMPWDTYYYSEKLKEKRYSFSSQEVRDYFKEKKVIDGLFQVVYQLFDVKFKEKKDVQVWNEDVKYYSLYKNDKEIAGVYMDLYARKGKRAGAWMDSVVSRKVKNGTVQNPVAYLIANFTPSTDDADVLLYHGEVETLFHEMGHVLHHLLTVEDYVDISGVNGVPWDGIELPSQFLENWSWDRESLKMITKHRETEKPISDELLDKMISAKNFNSALSLIRQLNFALLDMNTHVQNIPNNIDELQKNMMDIKQKYTVIPVLKEDHFENGFSHIFAGGYAAGYYSYKWAEVLSADSFMVFKDKGLYNKEISKKFLDNVLSKGGSDDFMKLVKSFIGREPKVDALLKLTGVKE